MKKRILFTIAVLLGIILFVFGVPIVINECYKTGGYVTLWSAEDVLSYYGTILGATVSVVVLAATILFTRKQIRHDQFVNTQSEKWKSVDAIINQAIEAVKNQYTNIDWTEYDTNKDGYFDNLHFGSCVNYIFHHNNIILS